MGALIFEYVCVLFVYRYTGFQRIARKVTRAQIFHRTLYISGCNCALNENMYELVTRVCIYIIYLE